MAPMFIPQQYLDVPIQCWQLLIEFQVEMIFCLSQIGLIDLIFELEMQLFIMWL